MRLKRSVRHQEAKINMDKAKINLDKAKEIERNNIKNGRRYVKIDRRTYKLR